MERKVFTYKDAEEAKKYIGNPGRFSENLFLLQEDPDGETVGVLKHIGIDGVPFATQDHECYQFYSPDPEPIEKWVPFTGADDLLGMKIRPKNVELGGCVIIGQNFNLIYMSDWETGIEEHTVESLFDGWEKLDGTPFGRKITEQ